jgi:hypothetical protein
MPGRYAFLSWRIIDQSAQDIYIAGAACGGLVSTGERLLGKAKAQGAPQEF